MKNLILMSKFDKILVLRSKIWVSCQKFGFPGHKLSNFGFTHQKFQFLGPKFGFNVNISQNFGFPGHNWSNFGFTRSKIYFFFGFPGQKGSVSRSKIWF